MNFIVLLGSAFALYIALVVAMKFAPDFFSRIGGAPDPGADNAPTGSFGDGDCGGGDD
jgi:hypothetical protein